MKVFIFLFVVYATACFAEIQNTSTENENASTSAETRNTRRVISRIFTRPRHTTRAHTSKLLDIISHRIPTVGGVKNILSSGEHGSGLSAEASIQPYKTLPHIHGHGLSAESLQSYKASPHVQVAHSSATNGSSDEIAYVAPYKRLHISASGESQNGAKSGGIAEKHETELSGETLLKLLQEYKMPDLDGASKKLLKGKLILYYDNDDNEEDSKEMIINTIPKKSEQVNNFNSIYKDVLELFTKYDVSPDIYYKILQNAMVEGNFGNDESIMQLLMTLNKYGNSNAHDDILQDIKVIITRNNKKNDHQGQQQDDIDVNHHNIGDDIEDIINNILNQKTEIDVKDNSNEGSIKMSTESTDIYNEIMHTIEAENSGSKTHVPPKINVKHQSDENIQNDSDFGIKKLPWTDQEYDTIKSMIEKEKLKGKIIPQKSDENDIPVTENNISEASHEINHNIHNYENSLEPQIEDGEIKRVPLRKPHTHNILTKTQTNDSDTKILFSTNENKHRRPLTNYRPRNRKNRKLGLYKTDVITLKKLINYVIEDITHLDNLPPILSNKPIDEYIKYKKGKPFLIYVIFPNHEEDPDHGITNIDESEILRDLYHSQEEDNNEDTTEDINSQHSLIILEILKRLEARGQSTENTDDDFENILRHRLHSNSDIIRDTETEENGNNVSNGDNSVYELLKHLIRKRHRNGREYTDADLQNARIDKTKLNKLKMLIGLILSNTYQPVTKQLIDEVLLALLNGKHNSLDAILDSLEQNNNDSNGEEFITSNNIQSSIKIATDKLIKNVYEILIALRRNHVSDSQIRTLIARVIEKGMLQITAQSLKMCTTRLHRQIDLGIKRALQKYKVFQH